MILRLMICAAVPLILSACGFQPLMMPGGSGPQEQLSAIEIRPIANRSGQMLRTSLTNAFNSRQSSRRTYTLEVMLSEPRQEIAIRRDESASRVSYTANANFVLRALDGRALMTGSSASSSTYEATNSEFASISAQRDARDRAIGEISADIRQQLAAFLLKQSKEASAR